MENTTKPKENENYWGYIIFAALILIYIPFADSIWGNSVNSTARTNNRPDRQIQTENQDQSNNNANGNNNATTTINYCSLPSNELIKQLTKERSYTLNGNGSVRFTDRFDHARNQWAESQIIITGNGKRLEGDWKLLANNHISITNLMATSGNVDASRNSRTRGLLVIDCNGNIKGMLMDPNGNRRDISIQKSR
ncbi:hypothetical protein [Confluentibacter sediminis]|uniref:hypothetical protein n=1 Tax=Confluentibacter sediminis TaxID=2219045 RepID=UPI000DADB9FF|nr:hypothetical protein [Confluentibacter sediminis]